MTVFLKDVNLRDLFANRPAAGQPGRKFYATDTGKEYRDNGSAWQDETPELAFVDLTDVPVAYAGAGAKLVRVKADASGLEFVAAPTVPADFVDLGDVPANYTAAGGKLVAVKGDATGLEFIAPSAVGVPTFVDDEIAGGSGTAWTLAHAPTPTASLILVQDVPDFGGVILKAGSDFTLAGANITTTNSLTAGALRAWYRY